MTRGGAIGCAALLTCADAPSPIPARTEPALLHDAVVAWEDGRIVHAGPRSSWGGAVDEEHRGAVLPGFVDCHTHLPFYGWRDDEFEARLRGRTYRDLHGEGGIARSARMLAEASDREVLDFSGRVLDEMLSHGTTTVELKTGYGLSIEGEIRQARLARRLADEAAQTATVTLLACHAVPPGMAREEWVRSACEELIPAAVLEGLADAVDIYVEDIAFSLPDLERVADAASGAGLPLRVHADQLGRTGAAEAAARLGARSADHLNHAGPEGIAALGAGGTVGVLLPASTLLLRAPEPSVAEMVEAGAAVAVATDCNPGTSPVASIPEAIALACSRYGLTPGQAVVATTINAARVLGLEDRLGSLAPGRRADFVLLDAPEPRAIPYRPGHNPVVATFIGGEPAQPGIDR
ncbi:MAG TPA: imidazolonepropionase [Actinomycetota bacterium]|nr:imidazolonepropionase [Actinomycetota bacterium]